MWHGAWGVLVCEERLVFSLSLPHMELIYLAVACREGYSAEAHCVNTIQMVDQY
jgi:hypothetical protein